MILLFEVCFCFGKADAFSTFEHIGGIAGVEVQAQGVVASDEVAGVDELVHPALFVGRIGFYQNFVDGEGQSVGRGQQQDRRVAPSVFFIQTVLYADIAVT